MTEPTEAANDRWTQLLVAAGDPHIAGRRLVQEVSDAAKEVEARLHRSDLADSPGTMRDTLKPFILPEPVDPLLVEAREIAAVTCETNNNNTGASLCRKGQWDSEPLVNNALAALKRGIELGKEQGR